MLVIISAERILATQEAFSDRSCVNVDGFWLCGAQNFFASNCHRHHLRFGISNHAQLQPNQQTNQPTDKQTNKHYVKPIVNGNGCPALKTAARLKPENRRAERFVLAAAESLNTLFLEFRTNAYVINVDFFDCRL